MSWRSPGEGSRSDLRALHRIESLQGRSRKAFLSVRPVRQGCSGFKIIKRQYISTSDGKRFPISLLTSRPLFLMCRRIAETSGWYDTTVGFSSASVS